ncbi:hypothetical protein HDE_05362 [Halotydeus destructor]|nr:hypothetical protein HDE_05362 [Halotydeus destructor]
MKVISSSLVFVFLYTTVAGILFKKVHHHHHIYAKTVEDYPHSLPKYEEPYQQLSEKYEEPEIVEKYQDVSYQEPTSDGQYETVQSEPYDEEVLQQCACKCPKSKYVKVEVPKTQVKYYPVAASTDEEPSSPPVFKPMITKQVYKQVGQMYGSTDKLTNGKNVTYVREDTRNPIEFEPISERKSESRYGQADEKDYENVQVDQEENSNQGDVRYVAPTSKPKYDYDYMMISLSKEKKRLTKESTVKPKLVRRTTQRPLSRSQLREFVKPQSTSLGASSTNYVMSTRSPFRFY